MGEQFRELDLRPPDAGTLCHCQEHDEKPKLFCEEDQRAVCLVCQLAEEHKSHTVRPIQEAFREYKEKLQQSLQTLQQDVEGIGKTQAKEQNKVKDLKEKADIFRARIESEFAKMHQILHNEEKTLKAKLNEKEKGILMKLEKNIKQLSEQSASLEGTMAEVHSKLALQKEEAPTLLKDIKGFIDSASRTLGTPAGVSEDLRLPEVEGVLQHIVWRRMRKALQPVLASLTLNPNTAHPCLTLSGDLRGIQITDEKQSLPDHPERFSNHLCVRASEGFASGAHYWEVAVQRNTKWAVGVTRESIDRKSLQSLKPGNGYWIIAGETGTPSMFTKLRTLIGSVNANPEYLKLTKSCDKIGVYLDYENGHVSFYNADDMCHIYTYTDRFNEKLYPIFFPGGQMKLITLNP